MRLELTAIALTGVLSVGCSAAPPTGPTPTPTSTSSPGANPFALNTVFLPAPQAPARSTTNPLVGRYQLEIVAEALTGTRCGSVPGYAARRSFTADILEAGAYCAVKLYDATFLADSSRVAYACQDGRLPQSGNAVCHQFLLTGDANAVNLTLAAEDDGRGTEVWEFLSDGFLLEITGGAAGAMRDGRIEATGKGSLWYGDGLPASRFYGCQSDSLRFTFTPR